MAAIGSAPPGWWGGSRVPLIPLAAVLLHAAAGCSMAYDTVSVPLDRAVTVRDSLLGALAGTRIGIVTSTGREHYGRWTMHAPDSLLVLTDDGRNVGMRTMEFSSVQYGGARYAVTLELPAGGVVGGLAGNALSNETEGGIGLPSTQDWTTFAGLVVGGSLGALAGRELGGGTEYQFATHGPPLRREAQGRSRRLQPTQPASTPATVRAEPLEAVASFSTIP